jgi:uncharacterized ferritin-like protein (DUF455 family)
MELNQWAYQILTSDRLSDKLACPEHLTDDSPGPALFVPEPARSPDLRFHKHSRKDRLPSLLALSNRDKRAVCLHRFAGHELLAVEIMAHALLAFPDAPKNFRRGVAHTLKEEQEHVRLYIARLNQMGVQFGDLPLYRHFWSYVHYINTPLKYLSMMSLTFEMANLDFAPIYGSAFASHGDFDSEKLMKQIFNDEIHHVAFGAKWLKNLKDPSLSPWNAWLQNVHHRITPSRAKGPQFYSEHRRLAGIDEEWIHHLHQSL